MFSDSTANTSAHKTRRIDFIFDIAYDADIATAKEIVARVLDEDPRVLKTPAPTIAVGALAASSVQLFVRPWVNTPDYWGVHFDVTERIKLEFDKAGIDIPFAQMDLHLPENATISTK